ncbi:hypothetical protein C8J57DRAFT_1233781 [Mycena rebaudengoi]|nr:hypothetical protein C8J57DRAFT_1233781 [Mycena rebaudengoi]
MAWANFGDRRRFDGDSTEIVSPNAFVFTNKGVEKALRIPEDSGTIDTLFELCKKGYETIARTDTRLLDLSQEPEGMRIEFGVLCGYRRRITSRRAFLTVHVIASHARHFKAELATRPFIV